MPFVLFVSFVLFITVCAISFVPAQNLCRLWYRLANVRVFLHVEKQYSTVQYCTVLYFLG